MAEQTAAKGSSGSAPQKAPISEVSIQPLPVMRAMVAQPLRRTTTVSPSETRSSTPETANITREAFATILYRYAEYKGYDVSVGEDTNILSFTHTGTQPRSR